LIDKQQHCDGTVTALVDVGSKPASAVPAPPAMPLIRAARPFDGPVPKDNKAPPAVMAAVKTHDCYVLEQAPEIAETVAYRLSATTTSGA